MSDIAVIGAQPQVGGFALAGARVYPADTPEAVRVAWAALPTTVGFVILTGAAAEALDGQPHKPGAPLRVVMPL
jgi:vacuolar-type H+-ATPase subunit F/Vma7